MALLPLASFAATYTDVDISTADVVITLQTSTPTYNNAVQTPTITKVEVDGVEYTSELTQFFTPKYYKKNALNNWIPQNADQIQDAGEYAVAIVANGAIDAERELQYTAGKESDDEDWAFYTIQKKDLNVTLGNGTKQYGGADPTELDVTPVNLPSGWTAPEFTWTGTLPIEGAHANVNAEGYPYSFPQNTLTGQTYVSSVNYNVFITNQPKLIVTKKAITLDYNGTAPSKVYGVGTLNADFLTGIKAVANYSLHSGSTLEGGDALSTVLAGITADGKVTTAFNYVAGKESANATPTGDPLATPAEHKLTITIAQDVADNYNFTVNKVALTVKQAELSTAAAAPYTFAKTEASSVFTYSAQDKNLTKTVTYTANNEKLLADGADPAVTPQVVVTYKVKPLGQTAAATDDAANTTAAGIYEAYIAPVSANGNFYTDSYHPIRVNAFDFTVNKKALYVYVTEGNITEVYKGSAYDLATETNITFQGLTTADAATTDITNAKNAVKVKVVDNSTNPATITTETTVTNADAYTIIPDVTVSGAAALHVNYDVQAYESTFTVSPLAITIDPKDMPNVVYGTAIAGTAAATVDDNTDPSNPVVGNVTVTKDNDIDPDILAADQALVLSAYNVVVAEKTYAAGQTYEKAITLVQKTLVPATTTAPNDQAIIDMLNNFTITPGTGDVTIGQGTYSIVVKTKNKTYGDALTWDIFDYLTPGLTGTTQLDPANVKFIVVDNAHTPAVTYSEYAGDALPKNAGTYTIKVDAEHSNLTITNYGVPTLNDGELTIAPKQLTVVTAEVKVNEGASVADLNTLGLSKVTFTGLEEGDAIAYKLAFNTSVVHTDATGNLNESAQDEAYINGYKVVAMTTAEIEAAGVEFANNNYTFKFGSADAATTIEAANATGNLKVVTGNLLALADDAQVIDRINIAADKCAADNTGNTLYNVEVTGRSLNLEKWNVVVLPFDITPYEFTQAIGRYAVFNTLESANTANNTVSFKLQLNNLKANEPFLVKPEKTKTDAAATTTIALTQFANRYIVAPANGVPQKTDVAGVKFIGAYNAFDLTLDEDWTGSEETISGVDYILDNGDAGKKIMYLGGGKFITATSTDKTKSYKTLPVAFTRAYLDFNESTLADARIFVEEADGTTTAISEITSEGVAVAAEGWYTIDGIKLQSVPTQKGIYINNGKKIVVK